MVRKYFQVAAAEGVETVLANLSDDYRLRNFAYFDIVIFGALLGIAALVLNIDRGDMATMTNTFTGVSGVLLGLYFVVVPPSDNRDYVVIELLLVSIFVSLISSLFSYGQAGGNRSLFALSTVLFEGSTVYFVLETRFLGPVRRKAAKS